ncbi:hypothetical protein CXG81DRAFT_27126 [Caulochytrium protostelioides]|uniref:sn-1-specific diacylglycerol lipase n=1 Tax=Caulochytrium protostelioides TaxID=1555241 RepID=A0A4P9X512_9FUNG|nr:hypothetical protein CXG81DRAFT_27126 [Caulochytrium protostelioides]|eukprot:RKP00162.1 hypothetical protein CXG81DRAFT_27126 [Caulochytrium protostelioides]
MGALIAFGRRWDIASDDFFLPGVVGLGIHAAQGLMAWALGQRVVAEAACVNAAPVAAVCTAIPIHMALLGITDVGMAVVALRGTVSDPAPRAPLVRWLYAAALLHLGWLVTLPAALAALHGPQPLDCAPAHTRLRLVLLLYVHGCIALGAVALVFAGLFYLRSAPLNDPAAASLERLEHLWYRRFSALCGGHDDDDDDDSGGRVDRAAAESAHATDSTPGAAATAAAVGDHLGGDPLRALARLFAELFHDMETVPSDVLVGMIMLRRRQVRRRRARSRLISPTSRSTTSRGRSRGRDGTDPEAVPGAKASSRPLPSMPPTAGTSDRDGAHPAIDAVLSEARHFYLFAEAIYGLPLHLYSGGLQTVRRAGRSLCCADDEDDEARVLEQTDPEMHRFMNAIRRHTAEASPFCCLSLFGSRALPVHVPSAVGNAMENALENGLPAGGSRLLLISTKNGLFECPFAVILDADANGTGRPTLVIAVRGTLSVRDVLVDLACEYTALPMPETPNAFTHSGMMRAAQLLLRQIDEAPHVARLLSVVPRVVTCGHSLGAGVAALVAVLLRRRGLPAFCYAFSPPGCIATADAADAMQAFVTCIVIGQDVIPRINRHAVERMKRDIARELARCDQPKWAVLGRGVVAWLLPSASRRYLRDRRDGDDDDDDDDDDGDGDGDDGDGEDESDGSGGDGGGGGARDRPAIPSEEQNSASPEAPDEGDPRPSLCEPQTPLLATRRSAGSRRSRPGARRASTHAAGPAAASRPAFSDTFPPTYLPGRILYFEPNDAILGDPEASAPAPATAAMVGPPSLEAPLPTPAGAGGRPRRRTRFGRATAPAVPWFARYTPRWARKEEFDEIWVGRMMGSDHMPTTCSELLRRHARLAHRRDDAVLRRRPS